MNDACIRQSETLVSNPIRSIIKITLTEKWALFFIHRNAYSCCMVCPHYNICVADAQNANEW